MLIASRYVNRIYRGGRTEPTVPGKERMLFCLEYAIEVQKGSDESLQTLFEFTLFARKFNEGGPEFPWEFVMDTWQLLEGNHLSSPRRMRVPTHRHFAYLLACACEGAKVGPVIGSPQDDKETCLVWRLPLADSPEKTTKFVHFDPIVLIHIFKVRSFYEPFALGLVPAIGRIKPL